MYELTMSGVYNPGLPRGSQQTLFPSVRDIYSSPPPFLGPWPFLPLTLDTCCVYFLFSPLTCSGVLPSTSSMHFFQSRNAPAFPFPRVDDGTSYYTDTPLHFDYIDSNNFASATRPPSAIILYVVLAASYSHHFDTLSHLPIYPPVIYSQQHRKVTLRLF